MKHPIDPAEMGDVWPAVQPGKPGDYGHAVLEPQTPSVIRTHATYRVIYTAGRFGLDDTGAIRIALRDVTDGGRLQVSDPTAPNFVSATTSNGVPLALTAERHGFRPWWNAVRVGVTGGFIRPGDTIEVVIGDTTQGSPGWLIQSIAERALEVKVSVDACATGNYARLDNALCFSVVPGPVHLWRAVAPTLRRPGENFDLGLRPEDVWGNAASPGECDVLLRADGPIDHLPERVHFHADQRAAQVPGLAISAPGTYRITAKDTAGSVLAVSDPITIQDAGSAGYWGDLHGQSGETVGIASLDDYMAYAQDCAFLDVTGHQGNDFQMTNAFWDRLNRTTAALNKDGSFIVFPGYEWSGNTPVGGDHNVFFRNEGCQIVRSSHAMLADRGDIASDANTLDGLFAALKTEDVVVWSHVGGRPADVGYAHDPALKTAVEVHSNWGTFEWILTDSLALGHRIGVVANSDGHKGRPGAGAPGATEFGAYGGLTCFLAPDLTRDALFECMRRRHHYGTSGSRMHLDVRAVFSSPSRMYSRDPRYVDGIPETVGSAVMGDIVQVLDDDVRLSVLVEAASPIERVDVMVGDTLIETARAYDEADLGRRVRVYWQGAEYRGRGRNTAWQGDIRTKNTAIVSMSPVNQWNLEKPIVQTASDRVAFEAVTSGNYGGVDLMLDGLDDLAVESNLVSGGTALSDLGLEDHVMDAGGLDRAIRVRRLPDTLTAMRLQRDFTIPVATHGDTAVWVRVTTSDGHQAWSSPIYLWR